MRVGDLLDRADMRSYTEMSVTAMCMEVWKAFQSKDGGSMMKDGETIQARNKLGKFMFDVPAEKMQRVTRAIEAGEVPTPLSRATPTFANEGIVLWNSHLDLRGASSKGGAKEIARKIGRASR